MGNGRLGSVDLRNSDAVDRLGDVPGVALTDGQKETCYLCGAPTLDGKCTECGHDNLADQICCGGGG